MDTPVPPQRTSTERLPIRWVCPVAFQTPSFFRNSHRTPRGRRLCGGETPSETASRATSGSTGAIKCRLGMFGGTSDSLVQPNNGQLRSGRRLGARLDSGHRSSHSGVLAQSFLRRRILDYSRCGLRHSHFLSRLRPSRFLLSAMRLPVLAVFSFVLELLPKSLPSGGLLVNVVAICHGPKGNG